MALKSRLLTAVSILSLSAACATTQQNQPTQPGGNSTVEELPNEQHEGAAQHQAPAEGATPAAPAAAGSNAQLNSFGGPEEGFTAKMPGGPPQVARNKVTTKAGDITTAAWNGNVESIIYSLSIADYPAKVVAARPPEAFLNEGRDGLVTQLKGKVVSEENITINDTYPGKAFTISSDNGQVKARNYLVGPRLYTMLVLFNPSIGAPLADGFLNSLSLINPPPRIERKGAGAAPAGTPPPAGTAAPGGTAAPAGTPAPGGTAAPADSGKK